MMVLKISSSRLDGARPGRARRRIPCGSSDGSCRRARPNRRGGAHAVEAGSVEGFEDIQRGEEERAGTAGGIEDGDFADGFEEREEKLGRGSFRPRPERTGGC